jgi:hypothetical protein
MPLSVQTRATAVQGEYVRLYCQFVKDGLLFDPYQPRVFITDNTYHQESSSSSTDNSSSSTSSLTDHSAHSSESSEPIGAMGPFYAVKETTGIWYVDFFVDPSMSTGVWYDIWTFQWYDSTEPEQNIYEFNVHSADSFINWVSPAIVNKVSNKVASMINDLENNFIFEAQHIPVYWEQGYPSSDKKTYNFAYGSWDKNYRVMIRQNKVIVPNGWYADYNGTIRFDTQRDREDYIEAHYYFKYFSQEELLDFLHLGLKMMNATPPSSWYYTSLASADFTWQAPILLFAAITALRRLVFGFNFQERAFVMAEDGAEQQRKIDNFKQLYSEYNALWLEIRKDVKSKRLPGIAQISVPEYTLPGGRSRWFRYLYKS